MGRATTTSNPRLRRCSRHQRRRRVSSQPQFMLYISVAAVIALLVAFDAEAMHPHHRHPHHQQADGQGYARARDSRGASTEGLRGVGQPRGSWGSAVAGGSSGSAIPAAQSFGRVEGPPASTANDHSSLRHGAAAAPPFLPAFVAAPSGWRRPAGMVGRYDQGPATAAAAATTTTTTAVETTRRFSSMTRQRPATQPPQQQQQQQQQHQQQRQRPLQIPTASQTDLVVAGGPRHDSFYGTSPADTTVPSSGGVDGDYGGYSRRQDYASRFDGATVGTPSSSATPGLAQGSSSRSSIGGRSSTIPLRAWGGSVGGGRGSGVGMSAAKEEGIAGLETEAERPPMLVTIGPQCAGKTSLLRALAAKSEAAWEREEGSGAVAGGAAGAVALSVMDVAIDDQPSVYHKIPAGLLLGGCATGSREDVRVARRPLSERLQDTGCLEARFVALRLSGHISAEEMADRVRACGGQASPQALAALCVAVEKAVSENVRVSTPTVDIFIREGLFPAAISSSQEQLASAARDSDGMVAWGNTNTQARDYRAALEQAELTGRPVRFLRWGHELPLLSLEELSRRNVYRFAATGRYIETAAVESALARVDRLYASTSGGHPASLALAAGFEMDASGEVRSTRSSGPTSHRRNQNQRPSTRRDGSRSRGTGGGRGGGGEERTRRRRTDGGPQGGGAVAGSSGGDGGGKDVRGSEGFRTGGSSTMATDSSKPWGRSASGSAEVYGSSGGGGGGRRRTDQAYRWQVASSDERLPQQPLAPPPPQPPVAQPLPPGPGRLTFDGAHGRRYENAAAATPPLGLAQGWFPRGGSGGESARGLVGAGTAGGNSRGWDYSDGSRGARGGGGGGARGGGAGGSSGVPPTVMFGNEWGRKRGWRRTGYTDDDIDPSMSSCFFRTPANSTGTLRRNDLGEGMGADLEEMELVRRIRSFRQRR